MMNGKFDFSAKSIPHILSMVTST